MKKHKDYGTITDTINTSCFMEECGIRWEKDVPLSKLTSFGVGGNAKYVIYPIDSEQLDRALKLIKKYDLRYFVLGRGSNILASDDGYSGILIVLRSNFAQMTIDGLNVTAQAGATTAQIAKYAKDNSLKGAEFLSVIPASIGGACYMNAGCFGYNISGIVTKIVATRGEGLVTFSKEECDFGYRTSRFQKEGWVICEITMRFEKGEKDYIKMLMNSLWAKKATTQPLGERTAGSVFLNKDNYYAAQLIEETGLKGFRLGNAQVSAKHSNFIVSHGATQREISNLIEVIKYAVKEKTGIILEQEIKFLGD